MGKEQEPETVESGPITRDSFAFSGLPMCFWCYWYIGGMECRAFSRYEHVPIPDAIMSNAFDHRDPYPGDNGRRFSHKFNDPAPEDW